VRPPKRLALINKPKGSKISSWDKRKGSKIPKIVLPSEKKSTKSHKKAKRNIMLGTEGDGISRPKLGEATDLNLAFDKNTVNTDRESVFALMKKVRGGKRAKTQFNTKKLKVRTQRKASEAIKGESLDGANSE
jgi:hypothetical protein